MCTHIAIIERGKLLASGDVQTILRSLQPHRTLEIRVLTDAERAEAQLRARPDVLNVQREALAAEAIAPGNSAPADTTASGDLAEEVTAMNTVPSSAPHAPDSRLLLVDFTGDERDMGELLAQLIAGGAIVTRFAEKSSDLEDIFMHVTKGIVQ
jgi:ABC-2 type transport system ATP-binding protein